MKTFSLPWLIGSCACFMLVSTDMKSQSPTDQLHLTDHDRKIENRIELQISEREYSRIKESAGEKLQLTKPIAIINGDTIKVDEIHARGKTSLYLRRKSFTFDMANKVTLRHDGKIFSPHKFNAVSLSMDRNYLRNRLAFQLLENIQLFKLFYTYGELRINNTSEGIYLLTERPQEWALKTQGSPLILRRGFNNEIVKLKTGKETDKNVSKQYRHHYTSIYQNLNKYTGEELYQTLGQWLDLDMYMTWLAFNHFVHNGDYTDEVFFYIDPDEKRYKVIPWDYDDIFAAAPHEGADAKKKLPGDKYIFSSEDRLDQKIASDPCLYQQYLLQYRKMLEQLTTEILKLTCENIYAELNPFYSEKEIITMSRYDVYKNVNLESLTNELTTIYMQLSASRLALLDILK